MGKQARISRQKLIDQGVDLSKPKPKLPPNPTQDITSSHGQRFLVLDGLYNPRTNASILLTTKTIYLPPSS